MGLRKLGVSLRAWGGYRGPDSWQRKQELYVSLEDQHREYHPGDVVKGELVVKIAEPVAAVHLGISCRGVVRVRALQMTRKSVMHVFFNQEINLMGQESPLSLPAGQHNFCFELDLPATGLFSSLVFNLGEVAYSLKGHLSTQKSHFTSPERALTVMCPIDVSLLPPAKSVALSVNVGSKKSPKKVNMQLDLSGKGFVRGEKIPVHLKINHCITVQGAAAVVITLARICIIHGEGLVSQTYRKDLDQSILPLYTDKNHKHSTDINTSLLAPPDSITTTPHHTLVSFQYLIEVVVDLSGRCDFQDWKNANPAVRFVDTDRFKQRSGIISAWSEVVVGTTRSKELPSRPPSSQRSVSNMDSVYLSDHFSLPSERNSSSRSNSSAPSTRSSPLEGPSQQSGQGHPPQNPGLAAGPCDAPGHSEKAILAAREATLLPSAPEYRAASAEPSAPCTSPSHELAPITEDKRELQRMRMQSLAQEYQDEAAPQYVQHAQEQQEPQLTPSAPPLPDEG